MSYSNNTWRKLINEVAHLLHYKFGLPNIYTLQKCKCGILNKIFISRGTKICDGCDSEILLDKFEWSLEKVDSFAIILYLLYLP